MKKIIIFIVLIFLVLWVTGGWESGVRVNKGTGVTEFYVQNQISMEGCREAFNKIKDTVDEKRNVFAQTTQSKHM